MDNVVEPIGFGCHRCGGFNAGWEYCPTCRIVELQSENLQLKRDKECHDRAIKEATEINDSLRQENDELRAALGERE